MAKKNTRPLSGPSQRKYFRDLFRAQEGVSGVAAERLTDLCAAELALIRVRLPMVVRRAGSKFTSDLKKSEASAGVAHAAEDAALAPAADASGSSTTAVDAGFDPHAFSLIVTFRKGGKDALLAKLDAVGDVTKLRAIAQAQHVSLDADLADRNAVLAALVEGTERRIAHRQAAAS